MFDAQILREQKQLPNRCSVRQCRFKSCKVSRTPRTCSTLLSPGYFNVSDKKYRAFSSLLTALSFTGRVWSSEMQGLLKRRKSTDCLVVRLLVVVPHILLAVLLRRYLFVGWQTFFLCQLRTGDDADTVKVADAVAVAAPLLVVPIHSPYLLALAGAEDQEDDQDELREDQGQVPVAGNMQSP